MGGCFLSAGAGGGSGSAHNFRRQGPVLPLASRGGVGAEPVARTPMRMRHAAKARFSLDNDLEGVALRLYEELSAWRESFDAVGLDHARLTGSGSSFFAIFDSEEEAEEALQAVLAQASALPKPRLACVTTPAHGVSKRL